jgi:hypothetical protein
VLLDFVAYSMLSKKPKEQSEEALEEQVEILQNLVGKAEPDKNN